MEINNIVLGKINKKKCYLNNGKYGHYLNYDAKYYKVPDYDAKNYKVPMMLKITRCLNG
jgi:hypothetical protein